MIIRVIACDVCGEIGGIAKKGERSQRGMEELRDEAGWSLSGKHISCEKCAEASRGAAEHFAKMVIKGRDLPERARDELRKQFMSPRRRVMRLTLAKSLIAVGTSRDDVYSILKLGPKERKETE